MVEVWNVTGYAVLPFVIAIIYSTTHCGSRKIAWYLDLFAIGAAFLVWWLVKRQVHGPLADVGALKVLISNFVGYAVVAVFLPVLYKILYAGLPTVHNDHGHGGH